MRAIGDVEQCEQCGMYIYTAKAREDLGSPADQRKDAILCDECYEGIRRELDEWSQWLDDCQTAENGG